LGAWLSYESRFLTHQSAAWVLKQSPQLWAITALETHLMQELPHRSLRRELAGELPEDHAATVRILNVLQAVARWRCEGRSSGE
jgi:hypothetical protein